MSLIKVDFLILYFQAKQGHRCSNPTSQWLKDVKYTQSKARNLEEPTLNSSNKSLDDQENEWIDILVLRSSIPLGKLKNNKNDFENKFECGS